MNNVQVHGNIHAVTKAEIHDVVLAQTDKGFFSLRIGLLQNKIQDLPWVNNCVVKRVWPDALVLTIEEQKPVARWGMSGFINIDGHIFTPKSLEHGNNLASLFACDVDSEQVLGRYLDFVSILKPLDLNLSQVYLSYNGAWSIMLANGIKLYLGKEQLEDRLKRFVLAYRGALKADRLAISYVDLRYTNGIAVKWK